MTMIKMIRWISTMSLSLSRSMRSTMPISWLSSRVRSSRMTMCRAFLVFGAILGCRGLVISKAWIGPIQDLRQLSKIFGQSATNQKTHRGLSITGVLDNMIETVIDKHISNFVRKWYVGEDELRYYIQHYRKGAKSKQVKASWPRANATKTIR